MCDPGPILLAVLLWPIVFPVNIVTFIASLVVTKRHLLLTISSAASLAATVAWISLTYNENHTIDEGVLMGAVFFAFAIVSFSRQLLGRSCRNAAAVAMVGTPLVLALGIIGTASLIYFVKPGVLSLGSAASFVGLGLVFLLVGVQSWLRLRSRELEDAFVATGDS